MMTYQKQKVPTVNNTFDTNHQNATLMNYRFQLRNKRNDNE